MKLRKEWVAKETRGSRNQTDLHYKKRMICVWWDWEGMVLWEMLDRNATVKKSSMLPSCIA
ncbi:Uncharacterized protein FKW44_024329 [Caligus rogercresseyi]|uniref:Uncharacterized protein n=1 Tax=Caligus rogercresseyi TaxID=217165 RepID=A0A7T8GLX4_CALRO|nr:Uncharacterized protein FKW44_024706 [Caligus rogercresseyi]QQP33085.1 Uncharacterized protein FKW44_024329 [Caligus rogercresseyi]